MWETYANEGKGFALGIDYVHLLRKQQRRCVESGEPFLFCAPVTYSPSRQRELVPRLVQTGIGDMQAFLRECSESSEDLTALRDRVTLEIVSYLFTMMDFFKAPKYSSEREMRVFLDANDGSLRAANIQYYQSGGNRIPYVFLDFRDRLTGRLPLAEIKVGPNALLTEEKEFLKDLLHELGYLQAPQISRSRLEF